MPCMSIEASFSPTLLTDCDARRVEDMLKSTVETIGNWWTLTDARGSPRVLAMEASIIAGDMNYKGVYFRHTPQLENQTPESLAATVGAAAKLKLVHGNAVTKDQAAKFARAW
jgi:myo-inositol catabolism protein IolC